MQKLNNVIKPAHHIFSFDGIGTSWRVSFDSDVHKGAIVKQQIAEIVETFDEHYSRFRDDSLVQTISHTAGYYVLPSTAEPLFDFYKKLYDVTEGAVTPLIGNLISDAGYDKDYSLQQSTLYDVPTWDQVLDYRYPVLRTHQPVILDFGAAGKGYLVDIIAAFFDNQNVMSYVINAGGDIYAKGLVEVALERPDNVTEAVGIATIDSQSICGSAGNRRTWGDFMHIMNPHTKKSQRSLAATWVVADTAMIADGLSTALFFTEPAMLMKLFTFEYAAIDNDGRLYCSDGFPATFFMSTER